MEISGIIKCNPFAGGYQDSPFSIYFNTIWIDSQVDIKNRILEHCCPAVRVPIEKSTTFT